MLRIAVPDHIAVCPVCRSSLTLTVTDWDAATGVPTEAGCALTCIALEPHEDDTPEALARQQQRHQRADQSGWLPVARQVYAHFARCCRVTGQQLREQRLIYDGAARPEDQRLREASAPLLPGLW